MNLLEHKDLVLHRERAEIGFGAAMEAQEKPTINFRTLKECMSHVLNLISKLKRQEYEQA